MNPPVKEQRPPGFRVYTSLLSLIALLAGGGSASGIWTAREIAATREVFGKAIIALEVQTKVQNEEIVTLKLDVRHALDYQARRTEITSVIGELVKTEALKK